MTQEQVAVTAEKIQRRQTKPGSEFRLHPHKAVLIE